MALLFEREFAPAGWFDSTATVEGWFDEDLGGATGPSYVYEHHPNASWDWQVELPESVEQLGDQGTTQMPVTFSGTATGGLPVGPEIEARRASDGVWVVVHSPGAYFSGSGTLNVDLPLTLGVRGTYDKIRASRPAYVYFGTTYMTWDVVGDRTSMVGVAPPADVDVTATLTAQAALQPAAERAHEAQATLEAAADLQSSPGEPRFAQATLEATAGLQVAADRVAVAHATLTATATVTSAAEFARDGQVALEAQAGLGADAAVTGSDGALGASASLTVTSAVDAIAGTALHAQATLAVEATVVGRELPLTAQAALEVTADVVEIRARFGLTWRDGTVVRKLTTNVTHFHPDFAVTHADRVPMFVQRTIPAGLPGNFEPDDLVANDLIAPESVGLVSGVSIGATYPSRLELRGDAPFVLATVTADPTGALASNVLSTHRAKATDVAGRPESWAWVGHVPESITDYLAPGGRVGNWMPVTMENDAPTQHQPTYEGWRSYTIPGKGSFTMQGSSGVALDVQARVDPASGLRATRWPMFQFGHPMDDSPRTVDATWRRRYWHASHPEGEYVPGDATFVTLGWVQHTETVYEWSDGPNGWARYPVEKPWVRYLYSARNALDLYSNRVQLENHFMEIVAYTRAASSAPIFYGRFVDFGGAAFQVPGFEGAPTFGVNHGLGFLHPEGDSLWRSPLGHDLGDYMTVLSERDYADTYLGNLASEWGALNGVGYSGIRDTLAICPVELPTDRYVSLVPGDHRQVEAQEAGLQAYQFDPEWPLRGVDVPGRMPDTAVPMAVDLKPEDHAVYTVSSEGIWVRWFKDAGVARSGYFEATALGIPGKEPWVWGCGMTPGEILVLAWDLEGEFGWTLLAVTLPGPVSPETGGAIAPPVTDLLQEQADGEDVDEVRVTQKGRAREVTAARSWGVGW